MSGRLNVLIAAIALVGCDAGEVKRGALHGTVTVDGAPMARGHIRLFSLTPGGAGTSAEIVDGAYRIPAERGPTAGTYRVEFEWPKPTGRKVYDPDTRVMVDEFVNALPARYHAQSTVQITFDPKSDAAHDFELRSR